MNENQRIDLLLENAIDRLSSDRLVPEPRVSSVPENFAGSFQGYSYV